jgi:hypothetical protein
MEKMAKKFNSFEEAERYNIDQQISMTTAQRLAAPSSEFPVPNLFSYNQFKY